MKSLHLAIMKTCVYICQFCRLKGNGFLLLNKNNFIIYPYIFYFDVFYPCYTFITEFHYFLGKFFVKITNAYLFIPVI